MNELQIQPLFTETITQPPGPRGGRWLLPLSMTVLLALAGGWTVWAARQESQVARATALEERTRQDEAMKKVLRELEAMRAELAAKPLPESAPRVEPEPAPRIEAKPVPQAAAPELSPAIPAEPEKRPKGKVRKFLTSSIMVDSAVLGSSLLVPPSIPLTLAQSRLGRRLTGRILKKTKTDKTVTGKVIRDVEDMPITQRRRR